MPRGDRTGPMGQGPMTGRGLGYCGGYDEPGYAHPGPGYGWGGYGWGGGWGGGWGRGWRHGYRATGLPFWARYGAGYGPWGPAPQAPTSEQEAAQLKSQAEWLQKQLDAIQGRLDEIQGGSQEG